LDGWYFSAGVDYLLPSTVVAPGAYVVIAQDPTALASKFGMSALGPFNADRSSGLSKYGEQITLRNAAGRW